MRTILTIFVMIMLVSPAYAGGSIRGCTIRDTSIGGGSTDYSDIIFYHDADAKDNANKAGGSATVTYGGGILVETTDPILGTGSWDNNNDGYDNLAIETSGNFDFASGRIGFYFQPQEIDAGYLAWTSGEDFVLQQNIITGAQDNFSLDYLGGSAADIGPTLSIGQTYFVELEFNGTTATLYVDGTSYGTVTGTGSIDDTNFNFYSYDGNAWDSWVDQVISSNDPDRDLYAVRDVTDFS